MFIMVFCISLNLTNTPNKTKVGACSSYSFYPFSWLRSYHSHRIWLGRPWGSQLAAEGAVFV